MQVAQIEGGDRLASISRAAAVVKLPTEQQAERLKPLPSKAEAIAV